MKIYSNFHTEFYLNGQSSFKRIKIFVILVALMLGFTIKSYSKNFYFSSSEGNDLYTAEQAQNPTTPWNSIDKLNSSMSLINPGDSILFKRGDVFTGQIALTQSGTANARIVLSAYGSGALPVIKGTLPVTGWSRYNGNIWQADCPQLDSSITNFFINGKSQQIGRYPNADAPNKGYLNIDSHVGSTSITSSSLLSTPNWTGGEAVVRTRRWILDRIAIQSHSGNTLNFGSTTTFEIYNNYGFFIQNHLSTLDRPGEWYFDFDDQKTYLYWLTDPNSLNTQATAFPSSLKASGQRYFTIENIEFQGSLLANISIIYSDHFELKNNIISESGNDAVFFSFCGYIYFINNKIINTNSKALTYQFCNNISTSNNQILNTGLRAGMGMRYTGVSVFNSVTNCLFEYNLIDSVGYNGVYFGGDSITIKRNIIKHFCSVLDDGGGIYTSGNSNKCILECNLILEGIGACEGTDNTSYSPVEGIYMDDRTANVAIINNTVASNNRGIYIHNSSSISIIGNTLYNNNTQLLLNHDNIAPNYPITNCIVNNNTLFSKSNVQLVADFRTIDNGIKNFGTFDHNYYCRPIDDNATIYTEYTNEIGTISNFMDLAIWQSTFNYDTNTKKSPYKISAYKITDLIGTSKLINVKFNNDIFGWSCWSNYKNGYVSWDNTDKLDGGSLKLGFSISSGKPDGISVASGSFDEVVSGESYILRFSIIASSLGKKVKIYLRKTSVPYNDLSTMQCISVDTERKEFELLFTPDLSETAAQIDFEIKEDDGPIWIDNVELFKATIQPANIDDSIKFVFNSLSTNKVVPLDGSYIDVKETKYSGSITLLPYTSAVLIVDPNPSVPPATPVYVSAAVENATPSVIEMTYNLTLANTVPATSAFSVQVNSVARTVTSVTVSGTKVLLTLGSPVAYGNVVTVSYTVPSSNPLQTSAGGKAAAVSAKSVTNKIIPPPSPVYVSSVIENATPSVIQMTYNLSLANIVPSASAFSVNVNSAVRNVSSVAVSGTKVLLTLASPVAYGNSVTVAYTKPSANPLQTSSGGQAATISAHTVTNKVNAVSQPVVVATPPAIVNTPPVVVVNNISGTYSGFIGKINASGSYDTNKDNLTYAWKVPGNIPVSATNSPVIEFLAPIVDANQTFEFSLTVSDGKSPQTKTVPVTIIPYEPGLEKADVLSVEATSYQSPYYPYNILDGNIGTMWSVNGYDQWIILELNGTYSIQHIKLAFQPGQKKEFYFDIFGSNDKENWEPILSKSRSCSFSGNLQVFDFPASKTEKEYRYVKLVGQGNSADKWNYISEFRIFGYRHKNPVDYEEQIVKIYPNPAHELINILIDEPTFMPDFIKIASLTGMVIYDDKVDPYIRQFQIPIDFKQGIYIVQMGSDGLTLFTQKLVVNN